MKRLLGDLLTLSRSDCCRLELVRQRIDPLPLLQELVDQSSQALARPIALEHHWPRGQGHRQILACPDQLKQVLLNLIENADKYSPKDSPIEVGLLHTLAGSTIQVKDHGDGILPDELPHIFERFYRGSSSHRQAGSGLGLSVVQLLVEAMGAAIQVESSPGQGSCFSLHWRADPPQVPA
jgi:signal transduction histidine kinase